MFIVGPIHSKNQVEVFFILSLREILLPGLERDWLVLIKQRQVGDNLQQNGRKNKEFAKNSQKCDCDFFRFSINILPQPPLLIEFCGKASQP